MTRITCSLEENLIQMNDRLHGCDDIKSRTMRLGKNVKIQACIFYVEVAVNNLTIEESVIGKLLSQMQDMTPEEQYEFLDENALGVTDVNLLPTIEEALTGIMVGDGVLFFDGYDKAVKIKSKGYPMMGISESKIEKVMRGSREGFCESVKGNTALIRKRLRSSDLKIKEKIVGRRSNTLVALAYAEGIVRKEVLEEVEKRLDSFEIDGILDSGMIEQLADEGHFSLFPRYQTTERPDRAAMAILDGRVVLLVDNSPVGLICPTGFFSFFQTADDYYNRPEEVSFIRFLRFFSTFLALALPAFYLALVSFHTGWLPARFVFSLAQARQGVPYPAVMEVLFMELSFELIREAGIRIPGPMGSTIGIVGGLIIGQAAVNANLASPIVVIVVALTALASFAIPNDEFSSAFRMLKYGFIALAACMGIYGILLGFLVLFIHLSRIESFGFSYLVRDHQLRIGQSAIQKMEKRSIYSDKKNRRRLRRRENL